MNQSTMLEVFKVIAQYLDPYWAYRLNHVRKAYLVSQRWYRKVGM